ncbi:MAG TPA: tripartite tricarboxylate transporter substrate binding protein [Burkholderiales bacterium]|nr:tripartite tricarboxylate transporter substrate binding protein [Burkholderiales bacterium]HYA47873.1 tripartite tricarboxylate transporter substrate binding protein [Burkholderiales bacterium]
MKFIIALAAALAAACASAQTYPGRPVTLTVGFAPGGGTDTVARVMQRKLGEYLGQTVVVENRAGAGGTIAAGIIAKAEPDGYSFLLATIAALAVAPHLNSKLPYNPLTDFAPVSMATESGNVLVVHPSVPAKTLAEYVKLANTRPGGIAYGTSGVGSAGHLAGELFRLTAKANLVHVPYKGGGPAMSDLLGGQIPSVFASATTATPQVQTGKLRALGSTGSKRSAALPDVPTIAEQGYPGYQATNWYAFVAPARTPKDIVARLNREIVKTLNDPDTHAAILKQGEEPVPSTPEELAQHMKREYDTWGRVIRDAGIPKEQ